jgi:L-rhamnose isomerase
MTLQESSRSLGQWLTGPHQYLQRIHADNPYNNIYCIVESFKSKHWNGVQNASLSLPGAEVTSPHSSSIHIYSVDILKYKNQKD